MQCGLLLRLMVMLKRKNDALLNLPSIDSPKPSFLASRRNVSVGDNRPIMMTEDRALELEEKKGGNK